MSQNVQRVCGHCQGNHVGGKGVCLNQAVGNHTRGRYRNCAGCTRQYGTNAPFYTGGTNVPQVQTQQPQSPLPQQPSQPRRAYTSFEFRIVLQLAANQPVRHVDIDRSHARVAQQFVEYGQVTVEHASTRVTFAAVAAGAVGGHVLSEFTTAAVNTRTTANMLEESGVLTSPSEFTGAVEDFRERPGRPSRHLDPAQRTAGGHSLRLWYSSDHSAACMIIVTLRCRGTAPSDPRISRAADFDPPILALNQAAHVLQRNTTNPRVVTVRAPTGARFRVDNGLLEFRLAGAGGWTGLVLDGNPVAAADAPGFATFARSVSGNGLTSGVAFNMFL